MKFSDITKIYEDDRVVVINKPAGLMVHADGRSDEITLADLFGEAYPASREVGEPLVLEKGMPGETVVHRPGIVHRLDRETSGVMILVKDQPTFLHLKRQFKDHTIKKVYKAFVHGHIKHDTGIIDSPIGRSKSDFRIRTVLDLHTNDARGNLRDAVTRYKVLFRWNPLWNNKLTPISMVEVFPETGRTHQIRTHMRSIRHPILGDTLYGPGYRDGIPFGAERTMLHAYKITLELHEKGQMTFEAEMPSDFEKLLEKLQTL